MKRTVLSADCFDLGDGGKEKQTTQIQRQNQPFSESDCNLSSDSVHSRLTPPGGTDPQAEDLF